MTTQMNFKLCIDRSVSREWLNKNGKRDVTYGEHRIQTETLQTPFDYCFFFTPGERCLQEQFLQQKKNFGEGTCLVIV
jgi:hypothetical protein